MFLSSNDPPDEPTVSNLLFAMHALAQRGELADLEWKSWLARLPDSLRLSKDVIEFRVLLRDLPEETAARLAFERSPDDVRAAERLVAALLAQDKPLPDDLHETVLRLQLREQPHDMALTYSLVALLCRRRCAPLPDQFGPEIADRSDLNDLLQLAENLARENDPFGVYAALWQVCVRHPQEFRGWTEFARRFAENREWRFCRDAAERVLGSTDRLDGPSPCCLLQALHALGQANQLSGLRYQEWIAKLPSPLRSTKAAIDLSANATRQFAMEELRKFAETYASNDFAAAYEHCVQAIQVDPVTAWHGVVNLYSNKFSILVENTAKRSHMEKMLESLYDKSPDMIAIPPPSDDPTILEKIKHKRTQNIEKGLPYYLFIPQAKSGSTSLGNIIAQGFRLTCTTYSMVSASVIPSWAREYAKGGASYITHLWPTPNNVEQLVRAGLKRAIVHTRDPRQLFLSQVHHFEIYRRDYPDLESVGFFSLSLNDRARHLIHRYREFGRPICDHIMD
jgi:hypothetical protein